MAMPGIYVKVEVVVWLESYNAVNVFYYQPETTEFGQSLAQDVAVAADAKFRDVYKDVLSLDVDFAGCHATLVNLEDSWIGSTVGDDPEPGLLVGSPLPNQDSAVIIKHIGKRNDIATRGRTFIAGCPENQVTHNNWVAAQKTALQAVGNAIDDNLTAGALSLLPATIRRGDGTFRLITSCTVSPQVKLNRKRRPLS